jgi:hypothetical protein
MPAWCRVEVWSWSFLNSNSALRFGRKRVCEQLGRRGRFHSLPLQVVEPQLLASMLFGAFQANCVSTNPHLSRLSSVQPSRSARGQVQLF